jgi:hypothetical protein
VRYQPGSSAPEATAAVVWSFSSGEVLQSRLTLRSPNRPQARWHCVMRLRKNKCDRGPGGRVHMQFERRKPPETPNAPYRAAHTKDETWRLAGPGFEPGRAGPRLSLRSTQPRLRHRLVCASPGHFTCPQASCHPRLITARRNVGKRRENYADANSQDVCSTRSPVTPFGVAFRSHAIHLQGSSCCLLPAHKCIACFGNICCKWYRVGLPSLCRRWIQGTSQLCPVRVGRCPRFGFFPSDVLHQVHGRHCFAGAFVGACAAIADSNYWCHGVSP